MIKRNLVSIAAACALALAVFTGCDNPVINNPGPSASPSPSASTDVAATSISIDATASLVVGGTKTLTATFTPANATNQGVTWASDTATVATVDASSGLITAVAAGTATITATAKADSTKTATCTVTVTAATPASVAVTSISLPGADSMLVGDTKTLTVTFTPTNATNQGVTWASDTATVATVDASSGLITAVAAGTAVITATSTDGAKTASCSVTVTTPVSAPSALFSDAGLVFIVSPATATTEKTLIASWDSGDTIANTNNTGAAKITFGSHPSGWSGAIALIQKPGNLVGSYDLTNVAKIKFKIKSADIAPANLTLVLQNGSDITATLASLGVTSMTAWTNVSVDVATLFGTNSKTTVSTALAFFWGSSAGDTTSLASGVSFEIGDIQLVDGSDNAVAFYSGVTQPTTPTALAAAPIPAAGSVISLYNSSATYTDVAVGNWNPNWGQGGSISDITVAGKSIKYLNLVNYQGINVSSDGSAAGTGVLDISAKKTLHISCWTHNGTGFNIYPIWAAGEAVIAVPQMAKDAWVDLEIDMSTAAGVDLTTIRQMKFDGGTGAYYFDNIYFH